MKVGDIVVIHTGKVRKFLFWYFNCTKVYLGQITKVENKMTLGIDNKQYYIKCNNELVSTVINAKNIKSYKVLIKGNE